MAIVKRTNELNIKSKIIITFIFFFVFIISLFGINILIRRYTGIYLPLDTTSGSIISLSASWAVLFSVFMYFVSKSITFPIKNLKEKIDTACKKLNVNVKNLPDNEFKEIEAYLDSIIHELSKTKSEIKNYDKQVEKEVFKKTEDLQKNIAELKKFKVATLNILEDINEANEQLKLLDIAKDEFVNVVSHELKTPLISIMGYSELMFDNKLGKLNPQQKKGVDAILRNSKRLKGLIDNILDISKLQSGKMTFDMRMENLNEVIDDVVEDILVLAKEKNLKIKTNVPKTIFYGDKRSIMQVVTNLLNNAIKFSPNDKDIKITAKTKGNIIKVEVKDEGIGIPANKQSDIFKKFQQMDESITRKYGGTGLGLNICKQIIEKHNGNIGLRSEEGKGSTFYFTLQTKKENNNHNKKLD